MKLDTVLDAVVDRDAAVLADIDDYEVSKDFVESLQSDIVEFAVDEEGNILAEQLKDILYENLGSLVESIREHAEGSMCDINDIESELEHIALRESCYA